MKKYPIDHPLPEEQIVAIPPFNIGKSEFYGDLSRVWVETDWGKEVACGVNDSFNFKKISSVTLSINQSLKATLKSEFGIDNIAKLSSGLEASTGISVSIEEKFVGEFGIPIIAPKCGQQFYRLYRMNYIYKLRQRKKTVFGKIKEIELPEIPGVSNEYIARIHWHFDHPNCPCENSPPPEKRRLVKIEFAKLLTIYVDGFISDDEKAVFLISGRYFEIAAPQISDNPLQVDLSDLPAYLRKLSNVRGTTAPVSLSVMPLPATSEGVPPFTQPLARPNPEVQ